MREGNKITRFDEEDRFLSNFSYVPGGIIYEEMIYDTVEHAYQAAKTLDISERVLIERCSTPGQAKRVGSKITLRKDWEQVKLGIMFILVYQKFQKSPLREQLETTKDMLLLEGNHWGDTYWGIEDGQGFNHLGQIIMLIRAMNRGLF